MRLHDVQHDQLGAAFLGQLQRPVQRAVAPRAQVRGQKNGAGLLGHRFSPVLGPGQRIPHPRSGLCRPRGHAFIVPPSVPSGLDPRQRLAGAGGSARAIRIPAGAPAQYNGSLDFPGPIHVFRYFARPAAYAVPGGHRGGSHDGGAVRRPPRHGLDGVCIIACVTALGGGSLRDVLLGHYPLTWVIHPEYLWMTAGARC